MRPTNTLYVLYHLPLNVPDVSPPPPHGVKLFMIGFIHWLVLLFLSCKVFSKTFFCLLLHKVAFLVC